MPRLGSNDMNVMNIAGNGNFQFSAVRPDILGATEYTLVTIVTDRSGSVDTFSARIDAMEEEVIKACAKNPRSENLLVRRVHFNHNIIEENGFTPLSDLPPVKPVSCGGNTALFDAVYTSIEATLTQADDLRRKDFSINGVVFIITDGENNASVNTKAMIRNKMEESMRQERIESLNTILIGLINKKDTDSRNLRLKQYLEEFKNEAKLSQLEFAEDVTANELAKIASFISRSISSQSQSLGTGSASVLLTI